MADGPEAGRGIDHIYCSSSMAARLESAAVVMGEGFRNVDKDGWVGSDHMPVRAVFTASAAAGAKL